jgi:hypothetical protein
MTEKHGLAKHRPDHPVHERVTEEHTTGPDRRKRS